MHKQVEHAQHRAMSAASHYRWIVILLALVVGVAVIAGNDSQHGAHLPNVSWPVVFGVLLWIYVAVQLKWNTGSALRGAPSDPIALARKLTRQVYIACYVLAGARLVQFTMGPASSNMLLEQSMQGLQPYIGYALPALIMGKVAAYFYMKRWAARAARTIEECTAL